MPFDVNRRSEICKRNNNRPGCCWYLCDNPKQSLCKNCYSCYSNCPHGVYEIINDEPQPVHHTTGDDVVSDDGMPTVDRVKRTAKNPDSHLNKT